MARSPHPKTSTAPPAAQRRLPEPTMKILSSLLISLFFALALTLSSARARADDLTTIKNPGGGKIVYGPLTGTQSLQQGMISVLRTVHGHFGERPQVGKFFQARDGQSIATFFHVMERTHRPTPRAVSGLVIVAMLEGGSPAAAVLYDDSARFPETEASMVKTLTAAWRSASKGAAARAPSNSAQPRGVAHGGYGAQPLTPTTGGDRSAAISLPVGWRLNGVKQGRLSAQGPNGEMVDFAMVFNVRDQAGGGYPGRGMPLVYPRTGDLFQAFVSVTNQMRRNMRAPEAAYNLIQARQIPPPPGGARAIQAAFEVDLHDGQGLRAGTARVVAAYPRNLPTWTLDVSMSNMPKAVADAEGPMMVAILESYTQDAGRIMQQAHDYVEKGHKDMAQEQVKMKQHWADIDRQGEAFDKHMTDIDRRGQAFDEHMDGGDRQAKAFQNYIFDRTELQDSERRERGAIGNADADALIKADPERFQAVPTQDFISGVDY